MGKISNLLFFVLFITVIYGFPQQQPKPSNQLQRDRPQNNNHPDKPNSQKPGAVGPSRHRSVRDTAEVSKPLDRSQISTLPAAVDLKKKDTVPQNEGQNRKTRDLDDEYKSVSSQTSTSTDYSASSSTANPASSTSTDNSASGRSTAYTPSSTSTDDSPSGSSTAYTSSSTSTANPAAVHYRKVDPDEPPSEVYSRETRDTDQHSKPLDRSQISTLPATVDFKKQDTVSHTVDQNRKTRDTVQQPKPLDRSQIGTLPAKVNINKEDTVPQKPSQESNSRHTRGADSSKQRPDQGGVKADSYRPKSQFQTPHSRDVPKPLAPPPPPSRSTKNVPVPSNEHRRPGHP